MTEENAQTGANAEPQLNILRIYLKDVSFEAPNSPGVFVQEFNPQVELKLNSNVTKLDADLYEVGLHVSVSAKHEEKTGFLVEIEQAGIFHIQGYNDEQLGPALNVACPKHLFPFAREAVSDLVLKGGFPQLLLAPINFAQLYQQQLAAKNNVAESE